MVLMSFKMVVLKPAWFLETMRVYLFEGMIYFRSTNFLVMAVDAEDKSITKFF